MPIGTDSASVTVLGCKACCAKHKCTYLLTYLLTYGQTYGRQAVTLHFPLHVDAVSVINKIFSNKYNI